MNHRATPDFWAAYKKLPFSIQRLADKNLKEDSRHPSLHFKKIGRFYSARVGLDYRALALFDSDELYWFWIGPHAEYERLIKSA